MRIESKTVAKISPTLWGWRVSVTTNYFTEEWDVNRWVSVPHPVTEVQHGTAETEEDADDAATAHLWNTYGLFVPFDEPKF